MSVSRRDDQYHTYGDYLHWSRDFGDEVIDGKAYVREPPAASWSHQAVVGELYRQLGNALESTPWRVAISAVDVRLPKGTERDEDVDTVVQPDVFITRDRGKIDQRGVRGAPDWLAEVLSPSTASHDRLRKIPRYERAGVPEAWLIDLRKRTVAIYRLSEGKYGPPTVLKLEGHIPLTAVPGVAVHWDPIISRALE